MLILYYLCRVLFKNSLSASFYYLMLKLSLFLYLFPLPLFTNTVREFIRNITGNQRLWEHDFSKENLNKMLFITDKGFYIAPTWTMSFQIIVGIWLLVMFAFILMHIFQYRRLRRTIKKSTTSTQKYSAKIKNASRPFKRQNKIDIRVLNQEQMPFSCGLIKPCIILPENLDDEKASIVIRHELAHIKAHDPLIRIVCILAIAIHFFNPFVYLLFCEIAKISELHCDERVTRELNNSQKIKQYGHLILDMAHYSVKSPFLSPFGYSSKKIMKERITMMKFPPKTKLHIALPVLVISVLASTIPVLAYNFPETTAYDEEYVQDTIEQDMTWIEPGIADVFPQDERHFKQTDTYLITEQGQIILNDIQSTAEPRTCSHSISTYTKKKHIKKSTGGCTVKTWQIRGCTKCSYTISKKLISTVQYDPCPHK